MSALPPLSGGKRTHCGHVATAVFDPPQTSTWFSIRMVGLPLKRSVSRDRRGLAPIEPIIQPGPHDVVGESGAHGFERSRACCCGDAEPSQVYIKIFELQAPATDESPFDAAA